jgi:uncharacterized protein YbjT (DUF2867 family)
MSKRIVVIGATGMMAPGVVREMARRGYETAAFVRNLEKARAVLPEETRLIAGDLSYREGLRSAVRDATHVYFHPRRRSTPPPPFSRSATGCGTSWMYCHPTRCC